MAVPENALRHCQSSRMHRTLRTPIKNTHRIAFEYRVLLSTQFCAPHLSPREVKRIPLVPTSQRSSTSIETMIVPQGKQIIVIVGKVMPQQDSDIRRAARLRVLMPQPMPVITNQRV